MWGVGVGWGKEKQLREGFQAEDSKCKGGVREVQMLKDFKRQETGPAVGNGLKEQDWGQDQLGDQLLGRKPEIVNCSKVSSILELLSLQYLWESKVGDLSLDGCVNQWISFS